MSNKDFTYRTIRLGDTYMKVVEKEAYKRSLEYGMRIPYTFILHEAIKEYAQSRNVKIENTERGNLDDAGKDLFVADKESKSDADGTVVNVITTFHPDEDEDREVEPTQMEQKYSDIREDDDDEDDEDDDEDYDEDEGRR